MLKAADVFVCKEQLVKLLELMIEHTLWFPKLDILDLEVWDKVGAI